MNPANKGALQTTIQPASHRSFKEDLFELYENFNTYKNVLQCEKETAKQLKNNLKAEIKTLTDRAQATCNSIPLHGIEVGHVSFYSQYVKFRSFFRFFFQATSFFLYKMFSHLNKNLRSIASPILREFTFVFSMFFSVWLVSFPPNSTRRSKKISALTKKLVKR